MILITGGTHGIGRACAERLARDGKQVAFIGRDREAGEALQSATAGTTYIPCDVAIEADCRRAVDEALRLGNGRLDGLVNNAGMSSRSAFAESSAAEWDEIMAVKRTQRIPVHPLRAFGAARCGRRDREHRVDRRQGR
jgi:NAD(P)-dependent dehydrogenase (short-subunit alcohol dehydrogenase family)